MKLSIFIAVKRIEKKKTYTFDCAQNSLGLFVRIT